MGCRLRDGQSGLAGKKQVRSRLEVLGAGKKQVSKRYRNQVCSRLGRLEAD